MKQPTINFYSPREEFWNAFTHGCGGVIVLLALTILGCSAYHQGTKVFLAVLVYGISLLTMYLASTLYHVTTNNSWKHFFRRMDHCAIYLLIAGTYTPLMLLAVGGPWGWGILIAVWGLAAIGITVKCFTMKECGGLSLYLYLIMGWLCMLCIRSLILGMTTPGLVLVIAGGILYTGGVIFYINPRPYFHAIWHLFVLAGSSCHFLAICTLVR